eukprot:TRINITY_DN21744_c0_g1_i1.p1 TRINITY_DN21744_c0_g1~~TRINITY_DN21744_c0_g1_i1.p1  ORF type:complete len:906 (-),score=137.90 TRINITY_DN21744_c0_g1_i1:66-2783(-)
MRWSHCVPIWFIYTIASRFAVSVKPVDLPAVGAINSTSVPVHVLHSGRDGDESARRRATAGRRNGRHRLHDLSGLNASTGVSGSAAVAGGRGAFVEAAAKQLNKSTTSAALVAARAAAGNFDKVATLSSGTINNTPDLGNANTLAFDVSGAGILRKRAAWRTHRRSGGHWRGVSPDAAHEPTARPSPAEVRDAVATGAFSDPAHAAASVFQEEGFPSMTAALSVAKGAMSAVAQAEQTIDDAANARRGPVPTLVSRDPSPGGALEAASRVASAVESAEEETEEVLSAKRQHVPVSWDIPRHSLPVVSRGVWGFLSYVEERGPVPLMVVGLLMVGIVACLLPGTMPAEAGSMSWSPGQRPPQSEVSLLAMVLLSSSRFYGGFLGAAAASFVLEERRAILIGEEDGGFSTGIGRVLFIASLAAICAAAVALAPVLGLLGDRMNHVSPSGGRSRLFVAGVMVQSGGLFYALWASNAESSRAHFDLHYGLATIPWMVGQVVADTIAEALVAERLPVGQRDAGVVVGMNTFLVGGLFGFLFVLTLPQVPSLSASSRYEAVSRLYFALLFVLCTCGLLTLLWARRLPPVRRLSTAVGTPLLASIMESYYAPMLHEGRFSRACGCIFVFGLASGPMYYTLPMVRDLLGAETESQAYLHFVAGTVLFIVAAMMHTFVSGDSQLAHLHAAGTASSDRSTVDGGDGERRHRVAEDNDEAGSDKSPNHDPSSEDSVGVATPRQSADDVGREVETLLHTTLWYACFVALPPCIVLAPTFHSRLLAYYLLSAALGFCLGNACKRFQALIWRVLPADACLGNALGVAYAVKNLGVGVGNVICGSILRQSISPGGSLGLAVGRSLDNTVLTEGTGVAHFARWIGMFLFCSACAIASVILQSGLRRRGGRRHPGFFWRLWS